MRRLGATGVAKARLRRDRYEALIAERGGLTLDQRADMFGLHRATMARIQTGEAEPRVGTALAIARYLGTTVENLWHLTSEVA